MMKTYDPDAIPVKAEQIPSQEVEGEIFAITPDDGVLHNFNEVGSLIWNLIDGRRPLAEIEESIAKEYEIDGESVRRDLSQFVKTLIKRGLIEFVP